MKQGLNRVARWAAVATIVLGSIAGICYWGLGISGKQISGETSVTVTGVFALMAGASAVVAMYCWVHANEDDDLPKYN